MSSDKIRLKLNSPTGKPVVLFASHQIEEDLKVWFEAQIDDLLHLQDPVDCELYKKSLQEDLEWFEVIYADLPILNLLQKSEDKKELTVFDGCVWII